MASINPQGGSLSLRLLLFIIKDMLIIWRDSIVSSHVQVLITSNDGGGVGEHLLSAFVLAVFIHPIPPNYQLFELRSSFMSSLGPVLCAHTH